MHKNKKLHLKFTYGDFVNLVPVVDLRAVQTSQFLLVPARFSLDDFRIISIRQHYLLMLWASHWQGLRGNAAVVVHLVNVAHG